MAMSHTNCSHPATSKARAQCRAEMAEGRPTKAVPINKKAAAPAKVPAKRVPAKNTTAATKAD